MHLERPVPPSTEPPNGPEPSSSRGAQASIQTLQKTGKKTGDALKVGAKQVEGWFHDIGNGIKEVGRKL